MKTRDLMTPHPSVVRTDDSFDQALRTMEGDDVRHLPVLEGRTLVGVLSDRDLLEATGWLTSHEREVVGAPEGVVRDLMHTPVISLPPNAPVERLIRELVEHRIGCVPIVDGEELVGIVTEIDVLVAFAQAVEDGRIGGEADPPLATLMQTEVGTLGPEASVDEALALFEQHHWRHLPVVSDDRVVGIVSDRDIRRERGTGQLELSTLAEVMMPKPILGAPDETLSTAARLLATAKVSSLPIVRNDRLVGLVTMVDLVEACGHALAALP
ncbi:MAG: CBS domain-containing protein [Planctomycetota bacterium]